MVILKLSASAVAMAIFLLTASATPGLQEILVADDPSEITRAYAISYPADQEIDLNSEDLHWIELTNIESMTPMICDGCDHCITIKHVNVVTDNEGKWWSPWCRVDGLATHNRGDSIGIEQTKEHSTTLNAEISISSSMIESLQAKLGYTVTDSKGWGQTIGCTNQDGIGHGLWLQEHIGFAKQTITETFTNIGCTRPPPGKSVRKVEVNWPDPRKTGFREFQYQCGWDLKGGNACNFDAKKNI